jgi:Winged helix-turn helix
MRPVSVFAKGPAGEIEQPEADLHGQWRQATRAVMVLLSLHGLPPAQIAALLDRHPATVRRWISRFNREGLAGLADPPRSGRPALGGQRLTGRIAALLARPGPRVPAADPAVPGLYGARYSPHDNPAERLWGALKNHVANTAVSWLGRLRQIHSFFRARPPGSDAGHRRALDQPMAAAGLRAELLECRLVSGRCGAGPPRPAPRPGGSWPGWLRSGPCCLPRCVTR